MAVAILLSDKLEFKAINIKIQKGIVYTRKRMKVSKGDWEVIKYANVRSPKKCEE